MSDKTFSPQEVREVLELAIEQQSRGSEGMTRNELVAAARELGVTEAQVETAIVARDARAGVEGELVRLQSRRIRRLRSHAVTFALVNLMLFGINVLTGGPWWFFWPLLGWGLGLALQAKTVVMPDPERDRERAERRLERRRQQALRDTRRQKAQLAVDQLVDVVGGGAFAVAESVSNKIRGELSARRRNESEPR